MWHIIIFFMLVFLSSILVISGQHIDHSRIQPITINSNNRKKYRHEKNNKEQNHYGYNIIKKGITIW